MHYIWQWSSEAAQDKCHCFVRTTQWENIWNSQEHTENYGESFIFQFKLNNQNLTKGKPGYLVKRIFVPDDKLEANTWMI